MQSHIALVCRKGELLQMRTRQVDLLNRTITLDPGTTKNGEGRAIKMTQEVYEVLLECVGGKATDDLLFTRKNGKPVLDFRGAWYSLCQKSGLGQLTKTEDGREKWETRGARQSETWFGEVSPSVCL